MMKNTINSNKDNNFVEEYRQHTKIYKPDTSNTPFLIGFNANGFINAWVIDADSVSIGRLNSNYENDISIPSSIVSSRHGIFTKKENEIYYEDLNSTNGSSINNKSIEEKTILKDGDIISISPVSDKSSAVIKLIFAYLPYSELSTQTIEIDESIEGIQIGSSSMLGDDCVKDEYMSRVHAGFIPKDNLLDVFDFNSTNGVYINNKRIVNQQSMKALDIVRMGNTFGCFADNKLVLLSQHSMETKMTQHENDTKTSNNHKEVLSYMNGKQSKIDDSKFKNVSMDNFIKHINPVKFTTKHQESLINARTITLTINIIRNIAADIIIGSIIGF